MNFILKLKHWQVFIILLIGLIASNVTWENHELFNLILNSFGLILYFTWYFAIGCELSEHLPPRVEIASTMFIINGFVLIISILVILAIFNGHFYNNDLLGFIWITYLIYAMIQFMLYPSKVLRTIEIEKRATFGQYFGYFLLTVFWPIGIWWIQPKLNTIEAINKIS